MNEQKTNKRRTMNEQKTNNEWFYSEGRTNKTSSYSLTMLSRTTSKGGIVATQRRCEKHGQIIKSPLLMASPEWEKLQERNMITTQE
ncbi:hypothetical protein [Capnocytophaga sp. HP1101]